MDFEIKKSVTVAEGRFLQLRNLHFTDNRGRERVWEAVARRNSTGAAIIVPRFVPSGDLLLVRQFRPPVGAMSIEFPAGLIDPGETPAETACRELYEETGYRGKVEKVFPSGSSSPGMSGEKVTIVTMTIEDALYPEPPVNHPEDTEYIECFRVKRDCFSRFLEERIAAGDCVDNKLFFCGLF